MNDEIISSAVSCDVRFCKTCDEDLSECSICDDGYELDPLKSCIVGGGGLDRAVLIGKLKYLHLHATLMHVALV